MSAGAGSNYSAADNKTFTVTAKGADTANIQLQGLINKIQKLKDTALEIGATITISGKGAVNGTAHALGTALKTGSWGATQTETALVGELGPELLVRGSRWTTIGENGAEFTQVKKGDIIFNHKQTEDLLSKGYITGRGKMHGSAFAGGTNNYTTSSNIGDDLRQYIYLLNQYDKDVCDAINSSNEYVKNLDDKYKKYGNIDNTDRNIVFWNDESYAKHYPYVEEQARFAGMDAAQFYDEQLRNSWSTVLGSSEAFEFDGQRLQVAYSQMLNTGADTILLTFDHG